MAAARLTEQEVHAACAEMAQQGEDPTAIKLLAKLERGSLTTITKYLKTWHSTEGLNARTTPKTIELSKHVVELETLRFRYELSLTELNALKIELQASNEALLESEKRVASLEEQLAVYKSLKPSVGDVEYTMIRKGPLIYKPKNQN